jgi:cell division protein YceG involved in septum cleavage
MTAAVHPAAGNWLYYVNGDAQGDLFFTNSEAAFTAAAEKCRVQHWGCG